MRVWHGIVVLGVTLSASGCDRILGLRKGILRECGTLDDGHTDEDCQCGDGKITPEIGEECDDGATANNDLCSSTCKEQRVFAIAAGGLHTCALISQGKIKCWGHNNYGQLGLDTSDPRGDDLDEIGTLSPVLLAPNEKAISISLGNLHTCARLQDNTMKCWGAGLYRRLGIGTSPNNPNIGDQKDEMGQVKPVALGIGRTSLTMALGLAHTCAILDNGDLKCWGRNNDGQLGQGNTSDWSTDQLDPVELASIPTAVVAVAASSHTCALLQQGKLKCWGSNTSGQLGLGDIQPRGMQATQMGDSLPPVSTGKGIDVAEIAVGASHTCIRSTDGRVKCWGSNDHGQLGLDDIEDRGDLAGEMADALLPVNLGTNATARQIGAGEAHTCALLHDGSVKCWGNNDYGQLGQNDKTPRGTMMGDMAALLAVRLGQPAIAIAVGSWHTCALLADERVKCWGRNNYGQLGLGDRLERGDDTGEMDNVDSVKLFSDVW